MNEIVMNRIYSNENKGLLKFAYVLEVSTDYLLGRTNTQEPTSNEKEEVEFQTFANNPELNTFYKELPESERRSSRKTSRNLGNHQKGL